MKVGIMQPYFFPYLGYFQLLKYVDLWVVFDDTQYVNKGWVNRNKILHPDEIKQWQYITIPLANKHRISKIKDLRMNEQQKWKSNILGKLSHYKRKAPFYDDTIELMEACFEYKSNMLTDFLTNSLRIVSKKLHIETPIILQNELHNLPENVDHPGQWALKISEILQAKTYVNPIGGKEIFKPQEFMNKKINLSFIEPQLKSYSQRNQNFVSSLSIIDLLMWRSRDSIIESINNDYSILKEVDLG